MRLLLAALTLLLTQSAWAQIALPFPGPGSRSAVVPITAPVSIGTNAAASTQTNTITTSVACPVGGTVFVATHFLKTTTISVSTTTDSAGNTYARVVQAGWNATNNDNQELWFAPVTSNLAISATIVTTLSAAPLAANPWPAVAACATGLISAPLDKNISTKYEPCTSCTMASGSSTTLSQANELIIGALGFYNSTPTITEGSGFTQVVDLNAGAPNNLRAHMAYQIVAATTAINYQPSINTTVFGGSMLGTFKGN